MSDKGSSECLGDALKTICDLTQIQVLHPPPTAHITGRSRSFCRESKEGLFAALSENEAQNATKSVHKYALHGRDQGISQACRPDRGVEMKCNFCFLCFRKDSKDFTMKIFFAWPSRRILQIEEKQSKKLRGMRRLRKTPRTQKPEILAKGLVGHTAGREMVTSGEAAETADSPKRKVAPYFKCKTSSQGNRAEVMQAVQDALYQQQGRWKRWLWGYGILRAEEILARQVPIFWSE